MNIGNVLFPVIEFNICSKLKFTLLHMMLKASYVSKTRCYNRMQNNYTYI